MLISQNAISMVSASSDAVDWDTLISDLRGFRHDTDRALRAAVRLDEQANAAQLGDLQQLLNDAEPFVRESAARPFARLQGPAALQVLLSVVRRCEQEGIPNRPLCIMASQLVMQNCDALEPLLVHMIGDAQAEMRRDAAWCFGFMPEEQAIGPLLVALQDAAPTVRIAAANSLRAFENPKVVNALCQALFDANEQVRIAVAATLSQIATIDTVSTLGRAQHDTSQAVRVFADYALRRLKSSSPAKGSKLRRWALFARA